MAVSPARQTLQWAGSTGLLLGAGISAISNAKHRRAMEDILSAYDTEAVFTERLAGALSGASGQELARVPAFEGADQPGQGRQALAERYTRLARAGHPWLLDLRTDFGLFGPEGLLTVAIDGDLRELPSGRRHWHREILVISEPLLADTPLGDPTKRMGVKISGLSVEEGAVARWIEEDGTPLRAAFEEGVDGAVAALLFDLGLDKNPQGAYWLGRSALAQKEFEEAEAFFRQAGSVPGAQRDLAVCLAHTKRIQEAVAMTEALAAAAPEDAAARYNLACWYAVELDQPEKSAPPLRGRPRRGFRSVESHREGLGQAFNVGHPTARNGMSPQHAFLDLALVISMAALLSWLSLVLRQPVILGYILCGVLIGPSGFSLVRDVQFVDDIGRVGVTLLLFLAGMVLHPQKMAQLFRQTALLTLGSCGLLFPLGAGLAWMWGFGFQDAAIVGLACMFSSTILVVKLLPTTTLHHQHMGAVCIAVLIAQDMIAVGCLLFISGLGAGAPGQALWLPMKAVALVGAAFAAEQWILRRMLRFSDHFHETLYLLCMGWCLAVAVAAEEIGLSLEAGAFIAGVAVARSPVAFFLSEGLKPLRDFFLVLFFFALGARLELASLGTVLWPALILVAILMVIKPLSTYVLLRGSGETAPFSWETALRLGQASEFSLILAFAAQKEGVLSDQGAQLVQLMAYLTLIASSYLVVLRFPTPLGRGKLQRV